MKIKKTKNRQLKSEAVHFVIYIDDMDRAKQFYSDLFHWEFDNHGSDEFLQIKESYREDAQIIGTFQSKKYNPFDEKMNSFECSIEVEDIDNIILKVHYNKGAIIIPKIEIPDVGWLVKFLDTEGNVVCAIQYHNK